MMLIAIWDFFFTRRQWKIVDIRYVSYLGKPIGPRYILQDQFGNVKVKDCW